MKPQKIYENIYWVGVIDWDVKHFHGHTYNTQRGTTYNAYLVLDDKITLVDTVLRPFAKEMIDRIKELVDPSKISYIIANHVERDHSGALPEILKVCPKAKIFCTQKCKEGLLKHYFGDWNFNIVKTGDKLSLGKKTLTFIEAPMIHWPDSMFTYLIEDQILMPNDAFGQHYATSERFDDEVNECELMDEAAKYYANILWPLSDLILKKIEDVEKAKVAIKMIAPSHGIIWRKDPSKIVNAYISWARNQTKPKAVIVYETMWGATGIMARNIAQGIIDSGISVKLFDVAEADFTQIFKEMLDAKALIFGSSTHDNLMLPKIASFLELFKGLKPKGRLAAAFGSYGWAGGAVKEIESILNEAGADIVKQGLEIKYVPSEEELKICYDWGRELAGLIRGGKN